MKYLKSLILSLVTLYLTFSFTTLELNPLKWTQDIRNLFVFLFAFYNGFRIFWQEMNKDF